MANDRKNEALGMNFSTASAQLKKHIMFRLMQQLELDMCFQCGEQIVTDEDLSVEHKTPWLSAPDPKAAFFNLNNIAFSHLSCNAGASNRDKEQCPEGHFYDRQSGGTRYCTICRRKYRREYRERNPEQDRREYRQKQGWVA